MTVRPATIARYLSREDARNLLLIAAAWALLLLLVPPQHEYPIIDDWNHANSVRTMLQTGRFVLPPTMQANLVGLTLWGAGWSMLFGFSFTTLTYSTLFLAVAGLFAFYGIARSLGVQPSGALLGTFLLAFNPIFVQLSYSFMTDVPFLSLVMVGCYFHIHSVRHNVRKAKVGWALLGGLFTGWAFLIRQFGLLVPAAFLLYLALDGLLTGRWRWRLMAAIAIVPVLVIGGWYVWVRDPNPTPGAIAAAGRSAQFMFKEPWLRVFLLRSVAILPVTALSAWGAVKMRPARWWLVVPWTMLLLWLAFNLDLPGEQWIQMYEPPFTAQLGPAAVSFPQEPFTFGDWGNIVRVTGIDFFEYKQEPVWSAGAWRTLWLTGLVLGAALMAKMTDALIDWMKERGRRVRAPISPRAGLYMLGGGMFVLSMALLGDMYDRYMLQFLPFLIVFVVRGSRDWGRVAWGYSMAALAVVAGFTMLAKADQVEHDNARWQAGEWLLARSGGLHGGYDWDNWMGHRNDAYQITDLPYNGYRTERRFAYFSRLGGFTTRYVLAQSRNDRPRLPNR